MPWISLFPVAFCYIYVGLEEQRLSDQVGSPVHQRISVRRRRFPPRLSLRDWEGGKFGPFPQRFSDT